MTDYGSHEPIDVSFHVPQKQRLRFTSDVFGDDQQVLADVLQPSQGQKARVQFWVDQCVAAANPDLQRRIREFSSRYQDQMIRVGNVQFAAGGEIVKNDVQVLERMLKVFNAASLDRRSYVVVIGGGAVLDAVGFAAAIAHRGIRLVRLPTTTLAQGDSGVGVKNAVNFFKKKNWIGTFATPWAVINDASLLKTLSDRDFVAGFSESVKVSLLKDPALFGSLCEHATKIRERDMSVALPIVRKSAIWHLDHITKGGDPFEVREARPLDFGHWSAHKMEPMSNYELRHGEAVGIGVAIDSVYSSLVHGLPKADAQRILRCLADLGLNLDHATLQDTDILFQGLEEFRQHLGGRLTVTMLRGVGDPIDVHEIDETAMRDAIQEVAQFAATTGNSCRLTSEK